jgi:peptidoglycan/xylan/chitin deacetylase (PgdA/CDA1 family)
MRMQKRLYSRFIAGFAFGLILLIIATVSLFNFLTPAKGNINEIHDNGYYSLAPGVMFSRNNSEATTSAPSQNQEAQVGPQAIIAPVQTGSEYCLDVPVLMYHHIQPNNLAVERGQTSLNVDSGVFDQQMAYIASSGYTAISADTLANALKTRSPLPAKPIVITMDDGYKDNFEYAFPIIQKYNLVANIMIPTGLMENSGWLTWSDLKTMVDSGKFNAYDHTWSHAALGGASAEKVQTEVMTAKKQLEEHLGKAVNVFAYPYGSESATVAQILSQNGFTLAFSTIPGRTQCDSFIMSLHRTRIGNGSLSSYGL